MPVSGDPIVEVRNLAKRYGANVAIRDVTFRVHVGRVFGLLGLNGAGKTTTLECLLGLRQPDAGSVVIDSIDARRDPAAAKARVGAQLQAAALPEKLTPRQALRYFGSFYADARPPEQLLAEFDLGAKADSPFDSLSGGQKQRLFLALAFVHGPRVVVLDEPTAGLDPGARRELQACITAARGRGVAVLLSTHDLDEAEQVCDEVAILHDGRVAAHGSPRELVAAAPRLVRFDIVTERPLAWSPEAGAGDVTVVCASSGIGHAPSSATCEAARLEIALGRVVAHLSATGNRLLDVRVQRPTLEDVFFAVTGSRWQEGGS